MDTLALTNQRVEERAVRAEGDRDFWHSTAAGYHFQLVQAGIAPNPTQPTPPSQRLLPPTLAGPSTTVDTA
jgi:hypothetical protein